MNKLNYSLINIFSFFYRLVLRRVFFIFDAERVHEFVINLGEGLGNIGFSKFIERFFHIYDPSLKQKIAGIDFENPIGLAAGFDYNAKLTGFMSATGFGFETVGTITNKPSEGNPKPRLSRLVESGSILVNKGFKNPGVLVVMQNVAGNKFNLPVGISIGQTNSDLSLDEAVGDIVSSFELLEKNGNPFHYYELNISCPNLSGSESFSDPDNLIKILNPIKGLKLKKPLFIKMPINKTNEETLEMLKIISSFPVVGVIFGNLEKNRNNPAIKTEEAFRFKDRKGNLSGKPTQARSRELIKLAYKNFGERLVIIGCGGIFSAEDAYEKIRNGASLLQLITGLIYKGPQLPYQINMGLIYLLKKDGFLHISEAVGVDANT